MLQVDSEKAFIADSKAESNESCSVNLNDLEEELQRRYQMEVIRSHYTEAFPAPKAYHLSQKDNATKLYDLVENRHFLALALKYAQSVHEQAIRALELKWMMSHVPPESDSQGETSDELRYWYNQMVNYDRLYNETIHNCQNDLKHILLGEIQLCYDITYKQEGFHECLEFFSETRSHSLKITITYDGTEITASSTMHMDKLKDVVEKCFQAKLPANILIRRIWQLFDETFIE